ncbi:DUF4179 domain-containing protein [Sporosarcina siberiensis]|uniref:DUF4179 domain-containing protein n=1 Tax=Sporosarcina siberiensis TaxID=1365606 RepID=A0ABW4SDZ6_9BACL
MYKNEEDKLEQWKKQIEERPISEIRLEQAIKNGFERGRLGKSRKNKRIYKRSIWSVFVAAILLITLVTSIRVSPVFANAIASIPGLERFVEFIREDKGLESAMNNEYYQELNLTSEKEGVTLTLKGVIADEEEMVLFYTLNGARKDEVFHLGLSDITDRKGNDVMRWGSATPDPISFETGKELAVKINIGFKEGVNESEFILKATAKSTEREIDFDIPFSLAKEKMPTTRYLVNETVSIEGQKVTIQQIEISPLKVAISIRTNPNNTKIIFGFEDLRLMDENGEMWTSINGITSSGTENEDEKIYYLESNYFENPEELTLMFNKLQAMDKDEAYILIDTEKEVILEQPADQRYSIQDIKKGYLEFLLKSEEGYHTSPFNSFIDAEGKEVSFTSGSFSSNGDDTAVIGMDFPKGPFVNPVKLPLHGYPQWIEGNVKVKINIR